MRQTPEDDNEDDDYDDDYKDYDKTFTWDLSNTNKSKYNGEHHSELAYHIRENKIKTARIQN